MEVNTNWERTIKWNLEEKKQKMQNSKQKVNLKIKKPEGQTDMTWPNNRSAALPK